MMKRIGGRLTRREALCLPVAAAALRASPSRLRCEEVRRIAAPEANQAVAVDADHFYAIDNSAIGKYEKKTGKRVSGWECERGKPLIHLDSGVIHDRVLYCAHSNYPDLPMVSSIETWDTKTLRHTGSHSFGIFNGSATWVDIRDGYRYVTFAHYRNNADEPSRNPKWTVLLQFDSDWRQLQGWVYPEEVVSKLGNYSISGGLFAPDGRLYCTGHDNAEVYVLRFPEGGSALVLEDIFPIPMNGQGIALDASEPGTLYGIDRRKREIIVTRLRAS
jgi:outer membrane protein assembly factor BamB